MRGVLLLALVWVAGIATCDSAGTVANPEAPPASTLLVPQGLVAAGESLYLASAFDSADVMWTHALGEARASHDTLAQARILTWLGLSARMRGDGIAARRYVEGGLALKLGHLDSAEAGESFNALGLLALDEDRLADARAAFETALVSPGDRFLRAKATGNLGLALAYLGELPEARQRLATMLDSSVALGERRYEANALANLAMLDIWEGRAAGATTTLARARAIYRTINYAPGEQNALGQLAVALEGQGQYGAAFAALDSSLDIARAKGMREDEAEILRLIAGLHARVGNLPAALRQYEAAVAAATAVGASGEAASIHRSMASVQLRLGNVDRARGEALVALEGHRATGSTIDETDDLIVLAGVEHRRGSRASSAKLLRDAGALAEKVGAPSLRRSVALEVARLADTDADADGTLRALRVLSRDRTRLDLAQLVDADALAARAWARKGSLDSAVAAGGRAIDALARLRDDLASDPLRRALLADRSRVYADQVMVLLRLGRTAEAFAVADAARSRGLLDHLASGGRAESSEGEQLLRKIDVLLRRLKGMEPAPGERGPGVAGTEARLARRLEEARGRYEAWLARSALLPVRRTALLGLAATSASRVQAALEPGERMLEYLVAGERLVLFVVSPTEIRALELTGDLGTLTERIRILRETWGAPGDGWRVALPAARALHQTLVAPAREAGLLEGATRLVVVPHGVVAQLPFAALRDERRQRWLVEDAEVLYLPSAAALPPLRERRPDAVTSIGNAAFAPFPRELPATREEVNAVRRASPGGVAWVGSTATEGAVRRALAQPRVVHVATHGVMNARNPMFSRVELARTREPLTVADDGRLEVHELLGLRVRSPLVFLAGCETSAFQSWLDDPVRGTDHTTLAQAFLQAGAGNVAGTLWRIDDAGAAAFAANFYVRLAGAAPVAALAAAQRDLLGDPRYASPYYWASYLLTGSGQLRSSPEDSASPSVP